MKKKILSLLAVLILCIMPITAYASEKDLSINAMESEGLFGCTISVGNGSNGINVTYSTKFTETATEIGCKNIVLEEKVNGAWQQISLPSVCSKNTNSYSGGGTYTAAVKGRTYRVSCTHYAVYKGVTYNLNNSSGEIVYN